MDFPNGHKTVLSFFSGKLWRKQLHVFEICCPKNCCWKKAHWGSVLRICREGELRETPVSNSRETNGLIQRKAGSYVIRCCFSYIDPLSHGFPNLGLLQFLDYNSHHPRTLVLLTRHDGSCSPKAVGGPNLGNPVLS